MSADLLAELDSFYKSPHAEGDGGPHKSQPQGQPPTVTSQGGTGIGSGSGSTFDFSILGPSSAPAPAQNQNQNQAWPSVQSQSSNNLWGDLGSLSGDAQTQDRHTGEDDDTWGDFEVADPSPSKPQQVSSPFGVLASPPAQVPAPEPIARNRIIRASTIDIMTNNLIDVGIEPRQPPKPSWAKQDKSPPKPKDPNVLFDADDMDDEEGDDDDDDDEFGDFETVDAPSQPAQLSQAIQPSYQAPSMDLLSLSDPAPAPAAVTSPASPGKKAPGLMLGNLNVNAPSSPYPKAPKSPSFQDRNPFPGLAVAAPKTDELKREDQPNSPSPVTAWPSFDDAKAEKEDDWAAFEDFPSDDTSKKVTAKPAEDSWDWDAVDNTQPTEPDSDHEPPPTNIPPPSILMSILPDLFNLSNNALFKPVTGQPASIKKKILSDPKTINFLRSYLLIATVAARILAGRRLRWHRDKFLAQGMAISAAGAKGMKLAGVDKAQTSREDREAADVAAAWKEQVGRLRSAVAAANVALPAGSGGALRVPEIGEQMHVTTAKVVPTAPRPCVICGLKRDERVSKVDFEVEDSFGEWWVEHWGHRACRNFWKEHEKKLRQR